MANTLAARMKGYEQCTTMMLNPDLYSIIRLDGRAFHTYTKDCARPFDLKFITLMNDTAIYLCTHITGAQVAFVQSDEITIALKRVTQADMFYRGNVCKIVSISAAMASAFFNRHPLSHPDKLALFDARVFQVPAIEEVVNNFIWRQDDCRKNSIAMVAQSLYSHAQLQGQNQEEQLRMCQEAHHPWESYCATLKWGRMIVKESYEKEAVFTRDDTSRPVKAVVTRQRWVAKSCLLWRENKEELLHHLK